MATGAYIGVNGKARQVKDVYIGVGGVARKVKSAYIGVNGVAHLFWGAGGGDAVILEVEKITSDTYAGETTYTGESFILLDIYPKTNGTVSVTYGGLTKTITDTSGAAEPNAQQVFFGTFNGVSDSVATPASGDLTIEGDYYGFACSSFSRTKVDPGNAYLGIQKVKSFGKVTCIPDYAFSASGLSPNIRNGCSNLQDIRIPISVEKIGESAFIGCDNLEHIFIPKSVSQIKSNPVYRKGRSTVSSVVEIDDQNSHYKIDGGCLVEIATNKAITIFSDGQIPAYITEIGDEAGVGVGESVTIPAGVSYIGRFAFHRDGPLNMTMLGTIPPTLDFASGAEVSNVFVKSDDLTITVPAGCGDAYKNAATWKGLSDYIVEAS